MRLVNLTGNELFYGSAVTIPVSTEYNVRQARCAPVVFYEDALPIDPQSVSATSSTLPLTIPLERHGFSVVENLPPPEPNTIFIVNENVLIALKGTRSDVYTPVFVNRFFNTIRALKQYADTPL